MTVARSHTGDVQPASDHVQPASDLSSVSNVDLFATAVDALLGTLAISERFQHVPHSRLIPSGLALQRLADGLAE